ncbi:MAG: DUF362 domain-containing protein [Bacillota bacterium]
MNATSTVAIVQDSSPRRAVLKVVALLRGAGVSLDVRGKKVLVKPNLALPVPPSVRPETTDPLVVAAVLEWVKEEGAQEIWVGDAPAWGARARDAFRVTGLAEVVRDLGVRAVYFDEEPRVEVPVPDAHVFPFLSLPRVVVEADVVVSVPKMKTSFMQEVTLGIKNLLGCIPFEQRKRFHREIDLGYVLADIARVVRPGLTIIDGMVAMEGYGPHAGTPKRVNLVIASDDVVAADAVGAALMGYDPRASVATQVAEKDGLGVAHLDQIRIVGEELSAVASVFKRPVLEFVNPNPNVRVHAGGICPGCRPRIKVVPPRVEVDKTYAVIIGREPIPLAGALDADEIWLVGNCGLRAGMAYLLRRQLSDAPGSKLVGRTKIHVVPGCPPLDWYAEESAFKALRASGWMTG